MSGLSKEDYLFSQKVGTIILHRFIETIKNHYLGYAPPQHKNFWADVKKFVLNPFLDAVQQESQKLFELTGKLVNSIEKVDKKMSETL